MINGQGEEPSTPEWWGENQHIRERYGLPDYEAPRFDDGTYTYEVVPEIEDAYGCEIRFIGLEKRSLVNWEVRVDGERVMDIPRRLDEQGNMIYGATADEFREMIEGYLKDNA